ncbi:hypothetical protein [Stenotrophomonas maltophilia]|uniref:hypothetical protein n=1 Tax=Stenotrophomonas maltophilia TaxID=40324 RepID=UPI002E787012|nr:hypothetical protein [Stenotrophomonas maltophilia]
MNTDNKTLSDVQPGGRVRLGGQPPFVFARFVNGVRMAEGVTIEKERNLTDAMQVAAKVASKGPNGEVPVLVHVAALSAQPSPGGQGDAQTVAKLRAMMDHSFGGPGFVVYGTAQSIAEVERRLAPDIAARQPVRDQHPDDLAVDAFAAAMKAKMAEARAKGRGGWEDPAQCTAEDLARMLRDHVEKGDPRDVANFCMMLHQRGEAISARQPVGEPVVTAEMLAAADKYYDSDEYRSGNFSDSHTNAACYRAMAAVAPPAQAVDLGQFREAVLCWRREQWSRTTYVPDAESSPGDNVERADRLLALLDRLAVGK